jgi:hypothetical protein
VNSTAHVYEVPLLGELCKSSQTALECRESLDGMGNLVGIRLNWFYCDVPEEIF